MSQGAPKDYKATLNLPRTDFPMKGNLAQLEPRLLAFWDEQRIFEQVVARRRDAPTFVLHDGPPYANGHLHAGHALNKILKDIVVKYRNLAGRKADFVPGWDCHGLPIEQAVEKRLREQKVDRRALGNDEFLRRCRAYAQEFIDVQREEFKRLGVLGRWSEPYTTQAHDYEAQELRELGTLAARGLLYRQKKPVSWCVVDRTALAEAEVEHDDAHRSPSLYVAFAAATDLGSCWPALAGRQVHFAVWTTTPWTLPANLAISVHPDLDYVFWALDDARVLVVARERLLPVLAVIAPGQLRHASATVGEGRFDGAALAEPGRLLAYASGKDLEGLTYRHVFLDRELPVVCGTHVTLEAGTGLVHTAPGHGHEDYAVGLAYHLDVYNPVRDDGRFDDSVPARLRGLTVFEANPVVEQWLQALGALLNPPGETVVHSYPTCWRCHSDVILRATPQWFITLDRTGLRQAALREIDQAVQWVPSWGQARIRGMLETRPDWCISRQRTWGVPIAVALCEACEEPMVSQALMERVAAEVERAGTGVWYATPVEQFLPEAHACPKCGGKAFRRETDILDVWFDSACSFAAVAARRANLGVPADLYLEGSDQHRGWFHSSLLVGVGTRGHAPYRACLTHGFVVDGQGNKMSKSQGNTVSPQAIIDRYGAEVLRLWVASSDYRDDVRLSFGILDGLAEGYRKIRNTVRYALSNLADFDPARDALAPSQLTPLDQWVLARLDDLVEKVRRAYEAYEFHLVYHAVVEFCASELSAVYFDIQKDALYTGRRQGQRRRGAQTALDRVVRELLVLLAPVASFTCEEAWQHLPEPRAPSVFLADFPSPRGMVDAGAVYELERLLEVRRGLLPLLEVARRDKRIGKSLEAQVTLAATGTARGRLEKHAVALAELFIVSQVHLAKGPLPDGQPVAEGVTATVAHASGQRCPRCWAYRAEVGAQELCDRCAEALR
jgi:isoleucyl-tRNA synthetase